MPAVAAIRRVSFSQDRRFPPPHTTIPAFIYTSTEKFLIRQAHRVPCNQEASRGFKKRVPSRWSWLSLQWANRNKTLDA
jgi:hypothetical protein